MLTPTSRLAARRVIQAKPCLSTTVSGTALRAFAPRVVLRRGSLTARRSFTVSLWRRYAAVTKSTNATGEAKSPRKKAKTKAKRKPKAKAKPKKKKKKVAKVPKRLTREEKAANSSAKKLKNLKKMALLQAPEHGKANSWIMYLGEKMSSNSGSFAERVTEAKSSYTNLSDSEKQQLAQKAKDRIEKQSKELADYVAGFPPEIIFMANRARARLSKTTTSKYKPLPDPRLPTHVASGFARYIREQTVNTPGGPGLADLVRQVAPLYRNMRDAEKEKYNGPARKELERKAALTKELQEKAYKYWNNEGIAPTSALSFGYVKRKQSAA